MDGLGDLQESKHRLKGTRNRPCRATDEYGLAAVYYLWVAVLEWQWPLVSVSTAYWSGLLSNTIILPSLTRSKNESKTGHAAIRGSLQ